MAGDARRDTARALTDVTDRACASHGLEAQLLGGYLPALLRVASAGQQLSREEVENCRVLGERAAQQGSSLPALVDFYMTATRLLWPQLPDLAHRPAGRRLTADDVVVMGEAVMHAADDALSGLAAGFVAAQRALLRHEEAARHEFLDDLLGGQTALSALIERAESYGVLLAGEHVVAVAQAERPLEEAGRVTDWVEEALRSRLGSQDVLATTRDGRLICVLSGSRAADANRDTYAADLAAVAQRAAAELASAKTWRVGLGRAYSGVRGVARSYRDALGALELAKRLKLDQRVVRAEQLLVYRVLLRDEGPMAELVESVLGPLTQARGGPGPLVETLVAYFAAGGNATGAARRLHLSVRAVTYRLERVQELTGRAPTDPAERLPLEVAVMGAQLLDWPDTPLPLDSD